MSSCGHSLEHLWKRCPECSKEILKIQGTCCTECGHDDNCSFQCPMCEESKSRVTRCKHARDEWLKICGRCQSEMDALDSKFCSSCKQKVNFYVFCKECSTKKDSSGNQSSLPPQFSRTQQQPTCASMLPQQTYRAAPIDPEPPPLQPQTQSVWSERTEETVPIENPSFAVGAGISSVQMLRDDTQRTEAVDEQALSSQSTESARSEPAMKEELPAWSSQSTESARSRINEKQASGSAEEQPSVQLQQQQLTGDDPTEMETPTATKDKLQLGWPEESSVAEQPAAHIKPESPHQESPVDAQAAEGSSESDTSLDTENRKHPITAAAGLGLPSREAIPEEQQLGSAEKPSDVKGTCAVGMEIPPEENVPFPSTTSDEQRKEAVKDMDKSPMAPVEQKNEAHELPSTELQALSSQSMESTRYASTKTEELPCGSEERKLPEQLKQQEITGDETAMEGLVTNKERDFSVTEQPLAEIKSKHPPTESLQQEIENQKHPSEVRPGTPSREEILEAMPPQPGLSLSTTASQPDKPRERYKSAWVDGNKDPLSHEPSVPVSSAEISDTYPLVKTEDLEIVESLIKPTDSDWKVQMAGPSKMQPASDQATGSSGVNRGTENPTTSTSPPESEQRSTHLKNWTEDRKLLNHIKSTFPNEKITTLKVRFHVLNDSIGFDPQYDTMVLVFKLTRLGGGNAAYSPFVITQDHWSSVEWKDSKDISHRLTHICYKFYLPKRYVESDRCTYEYVVRQQRQNGHSFVEEFWPHNRGRTILSFDYSGAILQFDGIVRDYNVSPIFVADRKLSDEYYIMVHELLSRSAVQELHERELPPTVTIWATEWLLLAQSSLHQCEKHRAAAVKHIVEQVMSSPSEHGFSTSEQKPTSEWMNSLELLRLSVEHGCFSKDRTLGLRQDSVIELLKCILPPLDYCPQNPGMTGRRDSALQRLLEYILSAENFFFELLYVLPAYHLLVLKIDPADDDLASRPFREGRFLWWCGFDDTETPLQELQRDVSYFKKHCERIDYDQLDTFLAKFSTIDPLLSRFFAVTTKGAYMDKFLRLRSVPDAVKLAALSHSPSLSKSLLGEIQTVTDSLLEGLSGLSDFGVSQCSEIAESFLKSKHTSDKLGLQLKLANCQLNCLLEMKSRRRRQKSKKKTSPEDHERQAHVELDKEFSKALKVIKDNYKKSEPSYDNFETLVQNYDDFYKSLSKYDKDSTEGVYRTCTKYLAKGLRDSKPDLLTKFFEASSTLMDLDPCVTRCLLESLLAQFVPGSTWKNWKDPTHLKKIFHKLFDSRKRNPEFNPTIAAVLSNVVCTAAVRFQSDASEAQAVPPELKMVLEWPIAACLLDFLGVQHFEENISPDARAALQSCLDAIKKASNDLTAVGSVKYTAIDYLVNTSNELEALYRQLKVSCDVQKQLRHLRGLKEQLDDIIRTIKRLTQFVQQSTSASYVSLESLNQLTCHENLQQLTISELNDEATGTQSLNYYRKQIESYGSLVPFLNQGTMFESRTMKELFNKLVEHGFKENKEQRLPFNELLHCLQESVTNWEGSVKDIVCGRATVKKVKKFLSNLIDEPNRSNLEEEVKILEEFCRQIPQNERIDVLRQLDTEKRISETCRAAMALNVFTERLQIETDDSAFSKVNQMRNQLRADLPIREIRDSGTDSDPFVVACREPKIVSALEAMSEARSIELFAWVRQNVRQEELNNFLDLAIIYLADAGESEQKKVEMFVRVAKDFAPVIYSIPKVPLKVVEIVNFLQPLLNRINERPVMLEELLETSARLSFLQEIKENQGSLEKSTMQKIEAIVSSGVIEIGCLVQHDEPFQLKILSMKDEKGCPKQLELDDIKELQSKLMLLAGESFEKRQLLEIFVSLMESVIRLVEAYKEFQVHCCVLCEKIAITIKLLPESDTNVSIELRYCRPHKVIKYKYGDIKEGLADLSSLFKNCLRDWVDLTSQVRQKLIYLNFFSLKQIKFLQKNLAPVFSSAKGVDKVDTDLTSLLDFIYPDCDSSVINISVEGAIMERTRVSADSRPDNDSFKLICDALTNEGYDERTIKQTIQILFRNPDVASRNIDELVEQAGELAGKVEKDFITQADQQSKANWRTADKDLTAAQLGNLPAHKAFQRLWQIYLRNISSSHSDFLSFADVNLFLSYLARQENSRRSQCKVHPDFRRTYQAGKPVSFSLEAEKHLLATVDLFNFAYKCLPQMEEVLCCSEHTSEEELVVFLHRAILEKNSESMYVIMNADQLSNSLSVVAEEQFNKLLNLVDGRIQSYFFVLSAIENQKQFPFCNCLRTYSQEFPTEMREIDAKAFVGNYLDAPTPKESKFLWIASDRSGMGKSMLCGNISKSRECQNPKVFCCSDTHLCADKLYTFFKTDEPPENDSSMVYHLDISREVQTGFDSCMTQLAILGGIVDSRGFVWRRKPKDLYLLEHSENRRLKARFKVLNLLPRINCLTPNEYLTKLEQQHQNTTPLSTELVLHTEKILTFSDVAMSLAQERPAGAKISAAEIIRRLIANCGVEDPSWLELLNFARFFHTQLSDMNKSIFCDPIVAQDLPGFRTFVLNFLLMMSKDFSTRSIACSDESDKPRDPASPGRITEFQLRRSWEQEPHPYLMFNQDGQSFTFVGFAIDKQGNLVDSVTNQVLKRSMMSRQLRERLVLQGVPLNEKFDDLNREEKISRMRTVFGFPDSKDFQDPDKSYELTMDNVKKILAIYMRFRSQIPVVLMGETGCGKTKLVEFLARIMQPASDESRSRLSNMRVLKVHGGISLSDIERAVTDAENLSIKTSEQFGDKSPYTILFFDEVNTTSFVGLIKEIMLDGRINGRRINFEYGLRCVAACNPYRKHPTSTIERLENSGLGYRVRKEDTQDRFGDIPMRHLVYRVKPLPLSLTCVLWDFGNLSEDAEAKYISRMISSRLELSDGEKQRLTTAVCESQRFMRHLNDETKYVSLREVERVIRMFEWLTKGQLIRAYNKEAKDNSLTDFEVNVLVTIATCYLCRLPQNDKKEFVMLVSNALKISRGPSEIRSIIQDFQNLFLRGIRLPESLAVNEALRENVFMMAVSITLRIPLFVVGKPGSSKSLSKTIVRSNMQGQNSQSSRFRQLPSTEMVSFQCSPWSTSEDISKVFLECAQKQKDFSPDHLVPVVVLDEIGLAEDSPKMPLKVLHPLLEEGVAMGTSKPTPGDSSSEPIHQKVGFIGISNWALDPAKMSRGFFLLRDVPTHDDLIETAKGICKQELRLIGEYLEPLTRFYLKLFTQSVFEREFFGLRDYFSLLKHLVSKLKIKSGELGGDKALAEVLLRNFSGVDGFNPVQLYCKENGSGINSQLQGYSALRDALKSAGSDQRYLLLITENYSGVKLLKRILDDEELKIVFGSSFPKDQEYSKVCRNINRIKICMERGNKVVLMNLEALYESLYDVLNLCYEQCGNDRFVDLGLGTHRLKCKVHENFRIIVIADRRTVNEKFPIPLINRLEKHKLTSEALMENENRSFSVVQQKWAEDLFKGEKLASVFVGFHEDMVQSLSLEPDTSAELVREAMLKVATPDSLMRLSDSSKRREMLERCYVNNHLGCLQSYLENYEFRKPFLQVTTYDRLLSREELEKLSKKVPSLGGVCHTNLNTCETESQFIEILQKSGDSNSCLILQYEGVDPSYQDLIFCAKYLIEEDYKQTTTSRKRLIILVIKLVRSHKNAFSGFDCGQWHCVHIEELLPPSRLNVRLLNELQSLADIFQTGEEAEPAISTAIPAGELRQPVNVKLLLQESLCTSLSFLNDRSRDADSQMQRRDILATALEDHLLLRGTKPFIRSALHHKETSLQLNSTRYNPNDWLISTAASSKRVLETGTFIESIWRILKQKVAPAFACFLAFVDKDNNLGNYANCDTRALWLELLEPAAAYDDATEQLMREAQLEVNRVEVASSAVDGHHFSSRFPFSWVIVCHFKSLEESLEKNKQGSQSQYDRAVEDSPIGKILGAQETSRPLIDNFCHDLLHIQFPSITEEQVAILQTIFVDSISEQCNSLLSAVQESIVRATEFKDQILVLVRLAKKASGLVKRLPKVTRLEDLAEAAFHAFIDIFEQDKLALNTASGRMEWIDRFNKSQATISSLLLKHRRGNMVSRWEKVTCVVLFLKNVTSPFDKEKMNESSIKPIRLWNGLAKNADLSFRQTSGIRLVEIFLEDMNKNLTEKICGASVCSVCEKRKDRLALLPCNDRVCDDCMRCNMEDNPVANCPKCKAEYDPVSIQAAKPEALDRFKQRCNVFMMEFVSLLCFKAADGLSESHPDGPHTEPPSPDLCKYLLTYVTRNSAESAVFGFFSDDKDPSPVFRSFILQHLLRFSYQEIVKQLDEHIQAAESALGPKSKQELSLIILNCLEDLAFTRLAKQNEQEKLTIAVAKLEELAKPETEICLEIDCLQRVVDHRVCLFLLANATVRLPPGAKIGSLTDQQSLSQVADILKSHEWSRIFFLRCLSMAGGTCAALERLQADDYLTDMFQSELRLSEGRPQIPDLLQSHSEVYRQLKKCLWQMFLTGELGQKKPSATESQNFTAALVTVNWEKRLQRHQPEADTNKLQQCLAQMSEWMSPETKNLYTKLKDLDVNRVEEYHTKVLLFHLRFSLSTANSKCDFVAFLSQLGSKLEEWYLPAMPHDELFEAFNAQGLKDKGLGAYCCPNGHPYYIGDCTRPWVVSKCPDCGSTIGGQLHTSAEGNTKYKSVDRTLKGFVPVTDGSRPEPVRQLSACSVALLRMLQSLTLMLHGHDGAEQEFQTSLRLFSGSTGRSTEDACHVLHLILTHQLGTNQEQTGFDLTNHSGRSTFEDRMHKGLIQPILDNLNDQLRDSNKIISEDDSGTTSEIVKLIHETSERDISDQQASLWRFRRLITVENARQAFQELGGTERGQYKLIDAVIQCEPVLRCVKELPVIAGLAEELVSAWKRNKDLKTTVSQKISAARMRSSRNPKAFETFIRVWNEVRRSLANRGARYKDGTVYPIEKHILQATADTPLTALLPHKKPWGRCIVGLVQLLTDAHNAVLDACRIEFDEVEMQNIDPTSVIAYDPDEDLLPMLLANCTYSLRKGEGCQVDYNFHGLQQQLLERLVRGRVRIVGHLSEMVYKEEFNLLELFQQLDRTVTQVTEAKDAATDSALKCQLNTPVITALLDESLKVAVNFLISLRAQPDPQMLLHDFLTVNLRMESGLPTESLRRHVTIDHIRLLWMSLDHQLWQQLADDGFEPSKFEGSEPLSAEDQRALPGDLVNRRSILMEKLHALIRLEMQSEPGVRDLSLNSLQELYPDYADIFDDWNDRLYGKHAGDIWMRLHLLPME